MRGPRGMMRSGLHPTSGSVEFLEPGSVMALASGEALAVRVSRNMEWMGLATVQRVNQWELVWFPF